MVYHSNQMDLTPEWQRKIKQYNYQRAAAYLNGQVNNDACINMKYNQKTRVIDAYTLNDATKLMAKYMTQSGTYNLNLNSMTDNQAKQALQNAARVRIGQNIQETYNTRGQIDGVDKGINQERHLYFKHLRANHPRKRAERLPIGVTKSQRANDIRRYGFSEDRKGNYTDSGINMVSLIRQDLPKDDNETDAQFEDECEARMKQYISYGEENKAKYGSNVFWRIAHQLSKDIDRNRDSFGEERTPLAKKHNEALDLSDNDNNPNWQDDYNNQIKSLTEQIFPEKDYMNDDEYQQDINQKANFLINGVIDGSNKWLNQTKLSRPITKQDKINSLTRGYQIRVNKLEEQLDPYKDQEKELKRDAPKMQQSQMSSQSTQEARQEQEMPQGDLDNDEDLLDDDLPY